MKVKFSDIESELEAQFNELMTHPEKFKLDDKTTKEIQELSYFAKRAGWKLVQDKAKAMLQKQNSEELADSVIEDLQEDGVKIVSLASLDILLAHPENSDFHLESEMVEHIQGLSPKEKEDLKHALADDLNIDDSSVTEKSIGQRILDAFKELWKELAPIFSNIVLQLTDFASAAAAKAIEKQVSGKIGEKLGTEVDKLIDGVGDTLSERIKTSPERIKEKEEQKMNTKATHKATKSVSFELTTPLVDKDSFSHFSSGSSSSSSSSSSTSSSGSSFASSLSSSSSLTDISASSAHTVTPTIGDSVEHIDHS